jgi:5'-nucleotidase
LIKNQFNHSEGAIMQHDPPIILIDQDGPLAAWEGEFFRRWRATNPDLPFVELFNRRHFYVADDLVELAPAEQREDIRAKVKEIYCAPGFYRDLPLVEGAKDALSQMMAADYQLRICTSPLRKYENCVLEKYQWIDKHLGPDFTERIILCRQKAFIRGDFLIDDRPDAADRDGMTPLWKHVVFDAPYNRHIEGKARLNRWDDWRSVVEPMLPKG